MLDQLVESKSHAQEDTRRTRFLLTIFIAMVLLFMGGYLKSLFAKDYGMGGDDLSLETLVAPPVVEEAPEPEPEKQEKQKDPNVDVREKLIQDINMSPKVPDKPSVVVNKIPPVRADRYAAIGSSNLDAANAPPADYKGPVNTTGTGSDSGNEGKGGNDESAGAPPPPPPVKKVVPKQISGGVLNGKATSLPKPPYPAAARAVRASGAVSVQVLIDENGNVVSASAVSGHPLLRAAAVAAARGAKFSPTQLSGQPVKVSGVITYNFVP